MKKFDQNEADLYDQSIVKKVPGYLDVLSDVAQRASIEIPQQGRVLALGAGTGTEIFLLGESRPDISFVAVDISEEMLSKMMIKNQARTIPLRIETHCVSLHDFVPEENFDGVLCLLTLHFIELNQKADVLRMIRNCLRESGTLWTYDLMNFEGRLKDLEEDQFLKWCSIERIADLKKEQLLKGLATKFSPIKEEEFESIALKTLGFRSATLYASHPRFRGYELKR